jgi:hypothetical protein
MTLIDTRSPDFDENWDFSIPGAYDAATNYYAGPFCSCGDYSCAAMTDENANCSTAEGERYAGSYYPEHWTDEDIDAYETKIATETAKYDNMLDAEDAAAKLA